MDHERVIRQISLRNDFSHHHLQARSQRVYREQKIEIGNFPSRIQRSRFILIRRRFNISTFKNTYSSRMENQQAEVRDITDLVMLANDKMPGLQTSL